MQVISFRPLATVLRIGRRTLTPKVPVPAPLPPMMGAAAEERGTVDPEGVPTPAPTMVGLSELGERAPAGKEGTSPLTWPLVAAIADRTFGLGEVSAGSMLPISREEEGADAG